MATFILVHGAWHGAWCWHKVVAALSAAGHRAIAIDLPSHGADPTPVADVTLGMYADRINREIDAQSELVILVGHSMGGIAISQAAEYRPDRIRSLVYLTAMLPSPEDTLVEAPDAPALVAHLTRSHDGAAVEIALEAVRDVFYADCGEDDVALARDRLCPQAAHVFESPLQLSREKFGSVPRYYIECLQDAALSPRVQQGFHRRMPCRKVYAMEASHSPFFSMPGRVAETLCDIAS